MKQSTIICDKCKQDITGLNSVHVKIASKYHSDNPMFEFDFCDNCYGKFIKTVGSWIKGE